MESCGGMNDVVLLLDNYGEDSRMLHQSFCSSGFTGPVIVIEDDGFFPEDVISVYQYFSGEFQKSGRVPGKARYFNQIHIPDYWEISASNSGGKDAQTGSFTFPVSHVRLFCHNLPIYCGCTESTPFQLFPITFTPDT